jgi:hypothetical protein
MRAEARALKSFALKSPQKYSKHLSFLIVFGKVLPPNYRVLIIRLWIENGR